MSPSTWPRMGTARLHKLAGLGRLAFAALVARVGGLAGLAGCLENPGSDARLGESIPVISQAAIPKGGALTFELIRENGIAMLHLRDFTRVELDSTEFLAWIYPASAPTTGLLQLEDPYALQGLHLELGRLDNHQEITLDTVAA